MGKKGLLVLLILGVLLLMGCENEAGKAITPLEVHGISEVWGEGTRTEPEITFFLDGSDSKLDSIDIYMSDSESSETYPLTVLTTTRNVAEGKYDNDDPITITLFYKAPKLTVRIKGGTLDGKKYVVTPAPALTPPD